MNAAHNRMSLARGIFAGGIPQTLLPEADEIAVSIFPVQIQSGPRDTPEKMLLRAVLDDAVLCLKRDLRHCSHRRGRRLLEEGLVWLTDGRSDYLTSFTSICRALNLNPSWVREGIFNAMARSLTYKEPGYLRRRCYTVNTRAADPEKAHAAAWKDAMAARRKKAA